MVRLKLYFVYGCSRPWASPINAYTCMLSKINPGSKCVQHPVLDWHWHLSTILEPKWAESDCQPGLPLIGTKDQAINGLPLPAAHFSHQTQRRRWINDILSLFSCPFSLRFHLITVIRELTRLPPPLNTVSLPANQSLSSTFSGSTFEDSE